MRLVLVTGVVLALAACGRSDDVVLQVKGSDTMVNLMQGMSEAYAKVEPKVIVAVTGGGTGTGVKSIIDRTADLAMASRPMKAPEIEAARRNGVEPHEIVIAYDGLAVYIHRDNPLRQISFEKLRCIYAADGGCQRWSDLGVSLDCGGDDTIIKVGRQNNSGTYEYFREEVLGRGGKFTNTMDQSGTQQVVDVVSTSRCAIGYGGMGYQTDVVRFVCLSRHEGEPCVEPSLEAVAAGKYPFARPLQVYTDGPPQGHVAAFVDWMLSEAGQRIVLESGFVPVPKAPAGTATGADADAAPADEAAPVEGATPAAEEGQP